MKFPRLLLPSALLLACTLSACGGGTTAASPSPSPSPSAAAEDTAQEQSGVLSVFTATDLNDQAVDQSILADYDLTMINVWGTFCPPCKEEMPALAELHTEYADQGFQIVGIVSDVLNQDGTLNPEQVEEARTIAEGSGVTYTNLLPSESLYPILGQIYALPSTFFVDSEGNQVGKFYMGAKTKDQWAAVIEETLEEVQ
ncbi:MULTISPECIES: TlpA disulfide reductase family protein [Eubacteriales]|uniref:TlpA family protein disulfide reductase n=1 Tax=Pseudoflavonifractor hominis TaxID=2763059 RepID=A0ABR7HPP5_9FIRM|nr:MULTISPECIES: TlpA disulfide reductase family protein [Eubacteriales]MBC5729485.1 TlpA family protein disulfide reductase [Pseudoflavonifractor hominis]MBS5134530.1 TlpA family protein disulfide reductase [Oscillospiraceae bacterium]